VDLRSTGARAGAGGFIHASWLTSWAATYQRLLRHRGAVRCSPLIPTAPGSLKLEPGRLAVNAFPISTSLPPRRGCCGGAFTRHERTCPPGPVQASPRSRLLAAAPRSAPSPLRLAGAWGVRGSAVGVAPLPAGGKRRSYSVSSRAGPCRSPLAFPSRTLRVLLRHRIRRARC